MSFFTFADLLYPLRGRLQHSIAVFPHVALPKRRAWRTHRESTAQRLLFHAFSFASAVLAIGGVALPATAQTAHFAYAKSQVAGGFNDPRGVAVDSSGNVYVADLSFTGSSNLWKETPSGATYTQTLVDGTLSRSDFVAVDGSGNIYVTESTSPGQVVIETLSNGAYSTSRIGTGLSYPMGIAVASTPFIKGLIYVGDTTESVFQEIPKGDGSYSQSRVLSALGNNLSGLGVDTNGASSSLLYAATSVNGTVTRYNTPFSPTSGSATVATGLSYPTGVAGDASGNVYIAEAQGLQRILKETIIQAGYTETTVASGLGSLYGLALDGAGNIYYSDETSKTVQRLQTSGVKFFSQNIGSTGATQTLTFAFDGNGATIGSVAVVTQGATGLDFANAGGGTCTAGTFYLPNNTCTVNVSFTPTAAGTRYGAVNLYDKSGNVIATAYVYGTGVGPQVAFSPGIQTVVASSVKNPVSVAVDGNGNLYIAESGTNRVVKQTFSGGTSTESLVVNTPSPPNGLAVDGSGAVYVALSRSGVLKEIPLPSGLYAQGVLPYPSPWGVAVDGSGNVYITDLSLGQVFKETLSATGYTQSVVMSGLNQPYGIAVDGAGNVYVADQDNNQVVQGTPSTSGNYTQSVVTSGINPIGVALDGTGNLYIADQLNSRVLKEVPSGSGSFTQSVVPTTGSVAPTYVAVDTAGNLYIVDNDVHVLKLDVADAPVLSFASTPVGTISSDSPQTLTIQNIGNAALGFSVPSSGTNPSVSSTNFSIAPDHVLIPSSSPEALEAGESLAEPISFAPQQAGSLSATLTGTTSNLNLTQSVPLVGTATPGTPTVNVAPTSISYGTLNAALSAAISFGGTAPTGQVTFTVDSLTPVIATCSVTGNTRTCTVNDPYPTLGAGQHTITATESADSNYIVVSGTGALTISPSTPSIVTFPVTIPYGTSAVTLNAQVFYSGPALPTGPAFFAVDAGPGVTGSCSASTQYVLTCTAIYVTSNLSVGAHTLHVSVNAQGNYTGNSNTDALTVTRITPTVTVGTPSPILYQTASTTLTAQVAYTGPAAPTGAVHFMIDSGTIVNGSCQPPVGSAFTCTATYPTSALQVTNSNNNKITATLDGDTNYTTASGIAQLSVTPPASFQTPACSLGTAVSTPSVNTVSVTPSCTEPQATPITATVDWETGQPTTVGLPVAGGVLISPAYPVLGISKMYTVTLTGTDAAGLMGTATQQVIIQPVLSASTSGTKQISTVIPIPAESSKVARQVTFVCTGVSVTINGTVVSNVLPSAYGITCNAPVQTVPAGSKSVAVNVTIMTNSAATVAGLHGLAGTDRPTFLAMLFPLSGLLPLLLCRVRMSRTKGRVQLLTGILLLSICSALSSCSNGYSPPPPVATPKAIYNLTIMEQDLTVPQPAGFVQTSLIVPLSVQ